MGAKRRTQQSKQGNSGEDGVQLQRHWQWRWRSTAAVMGDNTEETLINQQKILVRDDDDDDNNNYNGGEEEASVTPLTKITMVLQQ